MNWVNIFRRKDREERIRALEEDVRHERGTLAVNIVNLARLDNPLDMLVRQHLELLQKGL